jgi:uncharacterized iron-regulated membrane protein
VIDHPAAVPLRRVPRRVALRRVVGRLHLWVALFLGLYVVVLSVSGSAIVFRREFNQWLVPRTVASTQGVRLTGDALSTALTSVYPQATILVVREPERPERPVFVSLERGGQRTDRLFDPYAVRDLGETFPTSLRVVEWLVDLHDNLLADRTGRAINGVGALLFLTLVATGAWIWWPGVRHLRRAVVPGRPSVTRRFLWQLHGALGVWSLTLLLVWAVTAVYFAFPEPFERTIDFFDTDPNDLHRPGEALLLGLIQLHFGRFGGLTVRFLWVLLGLVPAVLFATGFVLWWTRTRRAKTESC